ncbi:hypothetical protein [Olsenella sp. HMSC062G07]|uniref:hypothetical protein n=1 Tax=Olsenella sp. HMSC062G07 TaxID=1739330 RepID=UPI0008A64BD3|nr:hypothetical protein [Olsenella sp. HMSC062G07]OFK24826.1 hypothetical protein HMPREF2826_06285 [Olsenella sp. HMSC062G07]
MSSCPQRSANLTMGGLGGGPSVREGPRQDPRAQARARLAQSPRTWQALIAVLVAALALLTALSVPEGLQSLPVARSARGAATGDACGVRPLPARVVREAMTLVGSGGRCARGGDAL